MLNVPLVGRLLHVVEDTRAKAAVYGAELYSATDLEGAKQAFSEHDIDTVWVPVPIWSSVLRLRVPRLKQVTRLKFI